MLRKAEAFARNVLGDEGKASEFADMDVGEYAERRGITIQNAGTPGRSNEREAAIMTKPEMETLLDDLDELLDGALDPRLSREQIVERVMEASDLISGPEEEEDDDEELDDDDDR